MNILKVLINESDIESVNFFVNHNSSHIIFYVFKYVHKPKLVSLTKYETLDYIREDVADFFLIDKNKNNDLILDKLEYPYVFKPNYCEDFAHHVEIIKSAKQAKDYIKKSIDDYASCAEISSRAI